MQPMLSERVGMTTRTKEMTSQQSCEQCVHILFFSLCILLSNVHNLQAITRYIKRCLKDEDTPAENEGTNPKKIKQIYNIRDVIKQAYRHLVDARIPFKSNEENYISHYQRAVTEVYENFDDSKLKEAEAMVEVWNTQGIPQKFQQK